MENWKKELESFFKEQKKIKKEQDRKIKKKKLEIQKFFKTVVHPIFQELETELKKYVKAVNLNLRGQYAEILVEIDKECKYRYDIIPRVSRTPEHDVVLLARGTRISFQNEVNLKKQVTRKKKKASRTQPMPSDFNFLPMEATSKTEIIKHFINGYKKTAAERLKQMDANFKMDG